MTIVSRWSPCCSHWRCIVVAAIVAAGCDTFFTIDATVTDCTTQAPLADVTAVLHLDDGFAEEDPRR